MRSIVYLQIELLNVYTSRQIQTIIISHPEQANAFGGNSVHLLWINSAQFINDGSKITSGPRLSLCYILTGSSSGFNTVFEHFNGARIFEIRCVRSNIPYPPRITHTSNNFTNNIIRIYVYINNSIKVKIILGSNMI